MRSHPEGALHNKNIDLGLCTGRIFTESKKQDLTLSLTLDLGIVAAIASSSRENVLDSKTVLFGEVGLAGEIRGISQAEARVKEAGKLGFERCVLPASNCAQLKHITHPQLSGVGSLSECWKLIF